MRTDHTTHGVAAVKAHTKLVAAIAGWLKAEIGDPQTNDYYESRAKDLISNIRPVIIESFQAAGYRVTNTD